MRHLSYLSFIVLTLFCNCSHPTKTIPEGPYFGNGFRNGWADQNSITIWTRLTKTAEGNLDGIQFLEVTREQHQQLEKVTNRDSLHAAQIPADLTLDDMLGSCPGMEGDVKLSYYPDNELENKVVIDWQPVDEEKDFTLQWHLKNLRPNTSYQVIMEARPEESSNSSDILVGHFYIPPSKETEKDIRFCVVTCHDFNRRDDSQNGHQIYPSMQSLNPDFYLHAGDIEYYDKPLPYALTEELMRFKWNRLFALPFQRDFFRQHTTYFMKDDHDALTNDAYPGMTYGEVNYERGLEIFDKEQFPSNDKPYKTIRWGKDLQIWIVEGRNYRSKNTDPDGPNKTIWGKTQKEWFYQTVQASNATFKVLMTSTPILGPDRKNKHDNYSNDNFKHEGDEIRAFIDQQENFFICNGDRHWQYVTHPEGTNLWEFSAGAGADTHAGGWKQEDKRPEHRFLRVKGGFLSGVVTRGDDVPTLKFQHYDVNGQMVHEEIFEVKK